MKITNFDYKLPNHLIAQTPILKRDTSKLLVLDKKTGEIEHKNFVDIIEYLNENDVLVINDTKVIPARLIGFKEETLAVIELLLLKNISNDEWECLVKPFKRIKVGTKIKFGKGELEAICLKKKREGIALFKLNYNGLLYEILNQLGQMPLPPYIHKKLNDKDRYQTVYANHLGSAAAPTAGLHFTPKLIEEIKAKGIKIVPITLHVGLDTFRPIKTEMIVDHEMHSEFYMMSAETALILNQAKKDHHRIISVGTTTTRTLETILKKHSEFKESQGFTDIFIYPGFKFQAIDGLITNFHLPKSTLLLLVSAFASRNKIMNAYKEAIAHEYRFFSFGDCMLIK